MIREILGGLVRSTGGLVNDVEEKDSGFLIVLELFQGITLLRCRTRNLKMFDSTKLQRFRHFFHQVVKLNEQQNALLFGDFSSTIS